MKRHSRQEEQKKYLTLKEAEELLPALQPILTQLQKLNHTLDLLETIEIETEEEDPEVVRAITRFNKVYHRLSYEFYQKLEKLDQMGVAVKDLEEGLVDFLSLFENREVFLCWKLGENSIGHWHESDCGYEERQRIVDLERRQFSMKN